MLILSGICVVLVVLVFIQVEWALPLYFLWLAVAGIYVGYQARFALMRPSGRPEKYEAVASVLFVMDLGAHVAVAVFCRVGWFGIVLLVLTYFCFGRLAGQLATGSALKDIFHILGEHEPHMNPEERVRLAHTMLEQRRREWNGPQK